MISLLGSRSLPTFRAQQNNYVKEEVRLIFCPRTANQACLSLQMSSDGGCQPGSRQPQVTKTELKSLEQWREPLLWHWSAETGGWHKAMQSLRLFLSWLLLWDGHPSTATWYITAGGSQEESEADVSRDTWFTDIGEHGDPWTKPAFCREGMRRNGCWVANEQYPLETGFLV